MEDLTDEFNRSPWLVESTITDPERRVRVHVTITVHAGQPERLTADAAEIAQMTAKRGMDQIQKCRKEIQEECPF
jgi:hypothetical protein